MTLISVSEVGVEFGATTLLKNVTFTVAQGERWGIVGRNGAGKTTIFRLITGTMQPTTGTIARQPNLRVALMEQHRDFGEAATVWDAAANAYASVIALEQSLHEQGLRLAELGDKVTEADLEKYGRDQERFAHDGGYDFHARVDAVLQGLGFDAEESKTRLLQGLSGGERGRVGLAAQLAAPADLVLLDEPTNHLDLETTAWLTKYLGELGETVIIISHDRAFLDDCVDHVLHVTGGSATPYRGGYSAFVTQRTERQLALERQLDKQRKFIAKEEDYIRRNLAGVNSSQAKGRRSKLSRLPRLSAAPGEGDVMALRLEITERGGDQVLVADKLTVAVGGRILAKNFTAVARRGDVVALVGPNGAGKSTLISTLLGDLPVTEGTARVGGSVKPAWFRQDLADLPMGKSIYDCVQDLRPLWGRGQIQGLMGAFGFSGDEVLRSTSSLSGGERARVALALITLSKANLLVLDEPTNHLDVESIEAIEDALEEYEGTVLLVSHDRAFLRELATRVWAYDGQHIEDFDGPFVEWEAHRSSRDKKRAAQAQAEDKAVRERDKAKAAKAASAPQTSGGKKADDATKKAAKRTADEYEKAVQRLEGQVAEIEEQLGDQQLYDGSAEGGKKAKALQHDLGKAQRALDDAMTRWAEAVETLEKLGA